MNNALESLKKEYKPYRYTKKKNVTILETTTGTFVVKEKENDKVANAYKYLLSRNFDYFPSLVKDERSDVNIFEYVDEVAMPKEQKALDMIDLVALLHNKTTYYKEVTEDKYKEIYENLKNNILYTKDYYDKLYLVLIEEIYPPPSHYLLLRNIYKIFSALDFCNEQLDNWYENVKVELKERVAFVHNNLETEHFLKNNREYLISWENSKIDTPILDLISFYQNEYLNLDFETLLRRYNKNYPLNDNEKKLLFIVISIPPIIEVYGSEIDIIKKIRSKLDYIFKTEGLVNSLYVSSEDI